MVITRYARSAKTKEETNGVVKNQEKWEGFGINMKLFGNIFETTDYNMFKKIKGNRALNKANLNAIITSMEQQQLVSPITVNEKFEIIDGQHRFAACKTLGLPVHFHIVNGYGTSEMKRFNTTGKSWNKQAFMHSYIDQGYENYVVFYDLLVSYDISLSMALTLIAHFQDKSYQLLSFNFEQGDLTLDGLEGVVCFLDKLEDFKSFPQYKTDKFVKAFFRLVNHPEYEHSKMLSKLATHRDKLKKMMTQDEYLSLLCNKIYSYGPTKNPIFYSSGSKRFHQ